MSPLESLAAAGLNVPMTSKFFVEGLISFG